ncbi:CDP-diacylglycerol--serine O-phosphatidyltransferase [Metabacillus fastidiosus]|uniref:CDP-diacylglycerol--serine O-phosphatidyltransferase n=1 Tax=Metabacillus fastidiosus TaxID=1458 RepID=UPI002DBA9B08|nr:CDP-diacylglycerol--serine O-phosphatidyltransferase [Metabacillus fastidiosus]MEC2077151.1 CDP-diacylglycerol--serine O-phosphatidyltransferase [Metabacillus fastidiosus]
MITDRIDHTIKLIKGQIANFITLLNLGFGIVSIIFILNNHVHISVLMIFLAALLDWFDGKIARKLNTVSEFGKQLDSLCDLVSFGLAPAILLYSTVLFEFGNPGIWMTVLFILCGAVRLAKFNVTTFTGSFVGLPITAAGCILTLSYMAIGFMSPQAYMWLTLCLAVLMVSPIEVKKY